MRVKYTKFNGVLMIVITIIIICISAAGIGFANDLPEIKNTGILRHLGITYAHFVRKTDNGYDGLDVEVMKLFAKHLGLRYKLVNTTFETLFTDLTGRRFDPKTQDYELVQTEKIKGDIIANGLTILPWRKKIVAYSRPTFPTGVWLIAPANSRLKPIIPSGDIHLDIKKVKFLLEGRTVLTLEGTCLSAKLYGLEKFHPEIKYFSQTNTINDMAPAIIHGIAETTLLDIPDAMVALQTWPGEIKIIGPISEPQVMGVAFPKSSPLLLKAFNEFFTQIWQNGTYRTLVEKYYPSVFLYFEDFFDKD